VTQDVELGVNAYWAPGATRTLAVPVAGAGAVAAGVSGTVVIEQASDGWGINLAAGWVSVQGDAVAAFADLDDGDLALLSWLCLGGGEFLATFILCEI